MSTRRSRHWLLAGALVLVCLLVARSSGAVIVERIVAVVGERPILLSDLRKRAKPHLIPILAQRPDAARLAAEESRVFRDVLERMIDDRLEEKAADRARITVSTQEIDRGIQAKAKSVNLPESELLSEARRQGFSEQEYRSEIRRQILEGKLINARVATRVRVTNEDVRAAYDRWRREMKGDALIDVRILALRIDATDTQEDREAKWNLAESLVERARSGEDFCKLVTEHSDDVQTKPTCGGRGKQPVSALLPPIAKALDGLGAGDVADPLPFGDQAILILKLQSAPGIPPFEEVENAMRERAMGEAIETQRKAWLKELRRGVYVDVRL